MISRKVSTEISSNALVIPVNSIKTKPKLQLNKKENSISELMKNIDNVEALDYMYQTFKDRYLRELEEKMVTKEQLALTLEESSKKQRDADTNLNKKIDDIPKLVHSCIDQQYKYFPQ